MKSISIAIVGTIALSAYQCVFSSPTTGFDWNEPLKSVAKLDLSSCQKMINDFLPGGSKFNGQLQTLTTDISSAVEKCIRIISEKAKQMGNVNQTMSNVTQVSGDSSDESTNGIRVHQVRTEFQKNASGGVSGQKNGFVSETHESMGSVGEQQSGFGKFSNSVRAPQLHATKNISQARAEDLIKPTTTTGSPLKGGLMGFDFKHLHIDDNGNYTNDQLNNQQPENFYDDEEQQQLDDNIDQQQLNMIQENHEQNSEEGQEEEEEEEEGSIPLQLNQSNSSKANN